MSTQPFNTPFAQMSQKTTGLRLQPPAGGEGKQARLNRKERRKLAAITRETERMLEEKRMGQR